MAKNKYNLYELQKKIHYKTVAPILTEWAEQSNGDVTDLARMAYVAGRNSISEEKKEKCRWIKYDYRTICPEKHDIDNPYWRIPENYKDALKYCPYCGKEIEYSWERGEDDG